MNKVTTPEYSQSTTLDDWDIISIRDRFATLSDCLEVPPDDPALLASELRSIADWFTLPGTIGGFQNE